MEDPETALQPGSRDSRKGGHSNHGYDHGLGFCWLLAQLLKGDTAFPCGVRKTKDGGREEEVGGEGRKLIPPNWSRYMWVCPKAGT